MTTCLRCHQGDPAEESARLWEALGMPMPPAVTPDDHCPGCNPEEVCHLGDLLEIPDALRRLYGDPAAFPMRDAIDARIHELLDAQRAEMDAADREWEARDRAKAERERRGGS